MAAPKKLPPGRPAGTTRPVEGPGSDRPGQQAAPGGRGEGLLRPAGVAALLGVGRSTLRRWVATGLFPAPLRLTGQSVRWHAQDVQDWIAGRPRGLAGDTSAR